VVQKGTPQAAQRIAHTRRPRHITECAVAIVAIERVAPVVGDEDVAVAVVLDVADDAGHPVAAVATSGRVGHVAEGAVAVVAIKMIADADMSIFGRLIVQSLQVAAIDQVEIQPAVLVVVEEGASGAGRLDDVAHLRVSEAVLKADAGGRGNIDEDRQVGRLGLRRGKRRRRADINRGKGRDERARHPPARPAHRRMGFIRKKPTASRLRALSAHARSSRCAQDRDMIPDRHWPGFDLTVPTHSGPSVSG